MKDIDLNYMQNGRQSEVERPQFPTTSVVGIDPAAFGNQMERSDVGRHQIGILGIGNDTSSKYVCYDSSSNAERFVLI